jgi:hypothetical protein
MKYREAKLLSDKLESEGHFAQVIECENGTYDVKATYCYSPMNFED